MPYTKKQHGLIGAALGAKKAGKKPPSYVPQSMAKLTGSKLGEMASSPTRKKIGKGQWDNQSKSAGGSCTLVQSSEMLNGEPLEPKILNHKMEEIEDTDDEPKMGKTQKRMTIGA